MRYLKLSRKVVLKFCSNRLVELFERPSALDVVHSHAISTRNNAKCYTKTC